MEIIKQAMWLTVMGRGKSRLGHVRIREEPSKAAGSIARMNLVCTRNRISTGAWQARGTGI